LAAKLFTPGEIVEELVSSPEFASRVAEFLHRYVDGPERGLFNECTQYGELHVLLRAWLQSTAVSKFVVDVGARGRERSNSWDLLRHFGWRGLLVEANPALIDSIKTDFAGLDVDVVNVAVSDYNGRAQLTIGANDDVSSLDPASAGGWGETRGQVEVAVRRLPDLLEECAAPERFDLLSLDIEGEDVRVLNDLTGDGRYRPTFVFLEASYNFATRSLDDIPTSDAVRSAYEILGQTPANILLRRRP
jgi:FkbM family methyltransferase